MKAQNNLARIRHQRGMTQPQLADLMGTTQGQISAWELGKRTPNAENVAKLCKALRTTPDRLFPNNDRNVQMSISEAADRKTYVKKTTNGLADLRERAGLSLRQVEEKTGLDTSTICKWESGMHNLPANAYRILCKAYNVTIEELLDAATNRPADEPKTPLEAARLRAGKGIAECAELLNFDAATYQKIEDGTLTVAVGSAIKLAKFFGIEDLNEFAKSFTKDGEI